MSAQRCLFAPRHSPAAIGAGVGTRHRAVATMAARHQPHTSRGTRRHRLARRQDARAHHGGAVGASSGHMYDARQISAQISVILNPTHFPPATSLWRNVRDGRECTRQSLLSLKVLAMPCPPPCPCPCLPACCAVLCCAVPCPGELCLGSPDPDGQSCQKVAVGLELLLEGRPCDGNSLALHWPWPWAFWTEAPLKGPRARRLPCWYQCRTAAIEHIIPTAEHRRKFTEDIQIDWNCEVCPLYYMDDRNERLISAVAEMPRVWLRLGTNEGYRNYATGSRCSISVGNGWSRGGSLTDPHGRPSCS